MAETNSLTGNSNDQVGYYITALTNGNYVVSSPDWNLRRGAATWGDGAAGIIGTAQATNSLVGSNPGDQVSSGLVYALRNGNYVVLSRNWNNGHGAATLGDGMYGSTVGPVDATNSLVG